MSMLAEQKRRTKWVINSTKKALWATDSSGIKFGKQLMEKMGWSVGKGLGLNEQGIQEPLKVGFKNDTKGMGFKENLDDWVEHQDEFNILLNQLRSNNDSSVVNGSSDEKNEITSLEEKSKQSKARVHYQKFTRGKDLSKYSANDLACILGTNKTKKEKPKTEDVIITESKVNGNCETSFGVTTINSGSIEDYFKKKLTIDKFKSGNPSSPVDKTLENPKSTYYNEKNCFLVNTEDSQVQEREGRNSRKRKHKSSSDFDSLQTQEAMLSELYETENPEGSGRKKKKNKEVDKEKHGSKTRNENVLEKRYVFEESESFSPETESNSNTGKKRKIEKKHMKLEITNFEEESIREIKERKRTKKNVEKCTMEDIFPSEKIHGTNNKGSTFEGESVKRKKKKKDREEKAEDNEVFENQYHICIQTECDNNHTSADVTEGEPVNNKNRRREESGKSDDITGKDFSNIQVLSKNHINDSCLDIEKTGKLGDIIDREDTMDVKSWKKKNKKKHKEGKAQKFDDNHSLNNKKVLSSDEVDVAGIEKINDKIEVHDIPEVSGKKKKKINKNKKENNQVEYEDYQNNQIEEAQLEEEFLEKMASHNQGENNLEIELVKKKRKKKHKKEKPIELESPVEMNCTEEEEIKNTFEEQNSEIVKKKTKKRDKKEKLEENEGIEKKKEQSEESEVAEMRKEIGKSGNITIAKLDLNKNDNVNNKNNNCNTGNDVFNNKTKAECRIEKLRTNLFHDKAADKYFPELGNNERVLKLIRWANLSEFRGSNLKDVEGYGRYKHYEKRFS